MEASVPHPHAVQNSAVIAPTVPAAAGHAQTLMKRTRVLAALVIATSVALGIFSRLPGVAAGVAVVAAVIGLRGIKRGSVRSLRIFGFCSALFALASVALLAGSIVVGSEVLDCACSRECVADTYTRVMAGEFARFQRHPARAGEGEGEAEEEQGQWGPDGRAVASSVEGGEPLADAAPAVPEPRPRGLRSHKKHGHGHHHGRVRAFVRSHLVPRLGRVHRDSHPRPHPHQERPSAEGQQVQVEEGGQRMPPPPHAAPAPAREGDLPPSPPFAPAPAPVAAAVSAAGAGPKLLPPLPPKEGDEEEKEEVVEQEGDEEETASPARMLRRGDGHHAADDAAPAPDAAALTAPLAAPAPDAAAAHGEEGRYVDRRHGKRGHHHRDGDENEEEEEAAREEPAPASASVGGAGSEDDNDDDNDNEEDDGGDYSHHGPAALVRAASRFTHGKALSSQEAFKAFADDACEAGPGMIAGVAAGCMAAFAIYLAAAITATRLAKNPEFAARGAAAAAAASTAGAPSGAVAAFPAQQPQPTAATVIGYAPNGTPIVVASPSAPSLSTAVRSFWDAGRAAVVSVTDVLPRNRGYAPVSQASGGPAEDPSSASSAGMDHHQQQQQQQARVQPYPLAVPGAYAGFVIGGQAASMSGHPAPPPAAPAGSPAAYAAAGAYPSLHQQQGGGGYLIATAPPEHGPSVSNGAALHGAGNGSPGSYAHYTYAVRKQ